jgi:hypothetical protein
VYRQTYAGVLIAENGKIKRLREAPGHGGRRGRIQAELNAAIASVARQDPLVP